MFFYPAALPAGVFGVESLGVGRGEDRRDVDPDARAHRGCHRQALEIVAFRGTRPGAIDRVDERGQVLAQLLAVEAGLAERRMNDPGLVDFELDAPGFDLFECT